MPDPRAADDVLAAPLDAGAATGTGDFVAEAPAGELDDVLMRAPPPTQKSFASFSFNVGPPGSFDNDTTWIAGCARLGMQPLRHVKSHVPSLPEMMAFVAQSPEWLLFTGHFYALGQMGILSPTLINDPIPDGTHFVAFQAQSGALKSAADSEILGRGAGFELHRKAEVVFWGGCNALRNAETADRLRELFGPQCLMLGFRSDTGWPITKAVFGGEVFDPPSGRMLRHPRPFFERVEGRLDDRPALRDAWLSTAAEWFDAAVCERFAAVDPDGTCWRVAAGGTPYVDEAFRAVAIP